MGHQFWHNVKSVSLLRTQELCWEWLNLNPKVYNWNFHLFNQINTLKIWNTKIIFVPHSIQKFSFFLIVSSVKLYVNKFGFFLITFVPMCVTVFSIASETRFHINNLITLLTNPISIGWNHKRRLELRIFYKNVTTSDDYELTHKHRLFSCDYFRLNKEMQSRLR